MGLGVTHSDDIDWEPTHFDDNGAALCKNSDIRFRKLTINKKNVECIVCAKILEDEVKRTIIDDLIFLGIGVAKVTDGKIENGLDDYLNGTDK